MPQHVVQSILEIRQFLTTSLGQLDRASPLAESLRAMQAACRKFLNEVQSIGGRRFEVPVEEAPADHRRTLLYRAHDLGMLQGLDEWQFLTALGELRGVFGICIGQIAVRYHIDVEEQLAAILPIVP